MCQKRKFAAQTAWMVAALAGLAMLAPSFAAAGIFTLVDDNSTAVIDTESQDGVMDWTVGGTDHLFQQCCCYRIAVSAEA